MLPLLDWAVFKATFSPDLYACKEANGACWGVVSHKWQIMLFGRYPENEIWRPMVFCLVWTSLLFASVYSTYSLRAKVVVWFVFAPMLLALMAGGWLDLNFVPTNLWGGLPLTLILSVLGMGLAFPLAILLALGRQSDIRSIRWICVAYIEVLRSLPLVTVLFLAAFVLPLLVEGSGGDLLVRVVITIACFAAAYLAEVVRGGLQSVGQGQTMAAMSLGLGFWRTQAFIVLPQAIRHCMPSLTNSFVTLFKECSLVSIVSLFELTGALGLALAGDLQWRQYYLEGYLFIGMIYWAYCFFLDRKVNKNRALLGQN